MIFLILLFSCKKEEEPDFSGTSVSPEFLIPLANFQFDLLNQLQSLNPVDTLPDTLLFNDTMYYAPEYIENTETVPISLSSISDNFNNVQLLHLRFIIYNGYPSSLSVNTSLNDSIGGMIFQETDDFIPAAPVNEDNLVIDSVMYVRDVPIDSTVFQQLSGVNQITFHYRIQTRSSEEIIHFYDHRYHDFYDIHIHVGARVKFILNP